MMDAFTAGALAVMVVDPVPSPAMVGALDVTPILGGATARGTATKRAIAAPRMARKAVGMAGDLRGMSYGGRNVSGPAMRSYGG